MELVLLWVGLSIAVGSYAHKKGRSRSNWILFSILVSPLFGAIFLALAAPITPPPVDELSKSWMKKCPECAEAIKAEATKCRYCHSAVPVED